MFTRRNETVDSHRATDDYRMTIAKFVQIRVLTITKNPYVPNSFDQSIHVCVLFDCEQTTFSSVTIRPLYYQSHVSHFYNLNDFITDAALI